MPVATSEPPHQQGHHHHSQHLLHPGHGHHHSMSQHQEQDVHGLRLALGSILSPKRLSPSGSSRPSSGSASPAHFGPGLVHPYHPSHLHDEMPNSSPPNRPISSLSRATSFPDQTDARSSGVHTPAHPSTEAHTPPHPSDLTHAHAHEHNAPAPVILTTSNVHALSASQAAEARDQAHSAALGDNGSASAAAKKEKERGMAAYIETLKSKRAWDALVHGNMS